MEDGPKTLSDIVRGGSRPQAKETSVAGPAPTPAAVASNMVEKTIASASAKVSQTTAVPNSPASQTLPESNTPSTTNSDLSPQSCHADHAKGGISSGCDVTSGGGGVTTVTTSRPVITASSVVSSGGHASGSGPTRAPPPPPAPALGGRNSQKADTKVSSANLM